MPGKSRQTLESVTQLLRKNGNYTEAYYVDLLAQSNKMYMAIQKKWMGYIFAATLLALGFGILLGVTAR